MFPNAPNVIPGLVKLSIEIRDLSADTVARLGTEITTRAQEVARQTDTEISLRRIEHDDPALADPAIQGLIAAAAASLDLKTMHLPSGAGHDAQLLAKLGPMGMVFVPSIAGISHHWSEDTKEEDIVLGAQVFADAAAAILQAG